MTAVTTVSSFALTAPDLSEAALAGVTARIAETAAEYDRTGALPWRGSGADQV